MGKKKKTYVKPEMKIIEVKTEGVIAASGGGIIDVPEEEWNDENLQICRHNMFSGNCGQYSGGASDVIGQVSECHLESPGYYVSCLKDSYTYNGKTIPAGKVTLYKHSDGKGGYIITLISGWR